MLVISRHIDEETLVFDSTGKLLLRIKQITVGNRPKIGLEGDQSLKILRREIYERNLVSGREVVNREAVLAAAKPQ